MLVAYSQYKKKIQNFLVKVKKSSIFIEHAQSGDEAN